MKMIADLQRAGFMRLGAVILLQLWGILMILTSRYQVACHLDPLD